MFTVAIGLFLLQTVNGDFLFPNIPDEFDNLKDPACNLDYETLRTNLKNLSLWAYEMIDSSGRSPKGVLSGNSFDFGNFEECINLVAPIKSKYCLVQIHLENIPIPDPPRNPVSLHFEPNEAVLRKLHVPDDQSQQRRDIVRIGWCIPASCKNKDLEAHLNNHLKNQEHIFYNHNVSFRAEIADILCQTNVSESIGALEILFFLLTTCLISAVISATVSDYKKRKTESKIERSTFENIFSAIVNFKDLSTTNYEEGLASLNGIKFFSFLPVFLAHVLCFAITFPLKNLDYIEGMAKSQIMMLFLNGSLFIDAFFLISGFLMFYKMIDSKLSALFVIFARFISLTPSLAYVVFMYAAALQHMGQGPLWNAVIKPEAADCRNNWWISLSYLSNYINSQNMCIFQTWYVDCDFHFTIVGVLLVALYKKHKGLAKLCTILCLIGSIVVSFIYLYQHNMKLLNSLAVRVIETLKSSPEFVIAYESSHVRAAPYLVGMYGGYLYRKMKQNKEKFSERQSKIIFYTSINFLTLAMFSGSLFYNEENNIGKFWTALYMSTYRLVWAVGTLGIIMSINFGDAYLMRKVLSWKPFGGLSKLIYGAYLVHMVLIFRHFAMTHTPFYYDSFAMVSLMFGYMVLSFMASLGLYLCIEGPVKNVYRELTKKKQEGTHENTSACHRLIGATLKNGKLE